MTEEGLRNLLIDISEAINMAVEAIDERDKLLAEDKKVWQWIPVSERLPEDYTDVIATVKEHYKDEIGYFVFPQARYSKEYGWEWPYEAGTDYWTGLNGVVAWMPLPEPYKASPTGAEGSEG